MSGSDTEGEDVSEVSVRPNFGWKELKTKTQLVKECFLAQLTDGWLTTKRNCIRCSAIVKASNNSSTKLVNHTKSCDKNLVIRRSLHRDGQLRITCKQKSRWPRQV